MFLIIKYKIVLIFLCLVICGCMRTPYRYDFSLVKPENKAMSFEDNNVQLKFIPSAESIWVSIRNKTDLKTNLVRGNTVFIDHLGKSHDIIYGNNFTNEIMMFGNNNRYIAPMNIDPGSEISGYFWINIWDNYSLVATPTRRANISELHFFMQPFFPRYSDEGNSEELMNSNFSLILPIEIDGRIKNYKFMFRINEVSEN